MSLNSAISVFIVDDESLARERLKRLIESDQSYSICGEAENGDQALSGVRKLQPDIVLLDIRMPGIDGLMVAQKLAELDHPPAIVFCTAYDEYAISAFKYRAIGYLLKPVRKEDLFQALKQATQLSQLQLKLLEAQRADSSKAFVAHTWQGHELIPMEDIYFFRADQKYLTIVHRAGETMSDQTLKELEQRYSSNLLRTHRNTLVNIAHICGLTKSYDGHYVLRIKGSEHVVPVSRRHVTEIKKRLEQLS